MTTAKDGTGTGGTIDGSRTMPEPAASPTDEHQRRGSEQRDAPTPAEPSAGTRRRPGEARGTRPGAGDRVTGDRLSP